MVANESLEGKIEKVVRSPFVSKKSTMELIKEATSFSNQNQFFNQLSNNPSYKRLIFLHRFDLFGIDNEINIPYLHICNIPEVEKTSEKKSKTLSHIVSSELETAISGSEFCTKIFGLDINEWDIFTQDIYDLVAYFSIQFIRANPNIKKLVNAEKFDYQLMNYTLKNYEDTINFEAFLDEIDAGYSEVEGEIDSIIKSKMEKIILSMASGMMKNIDKFIENTPKIVPQFILSFHLSSTLWLNNLLKKSGLSFREYVDILDDLYRYHLIENKSTIFWCENCSIESPSYSQHIGRVAPSKMSRNICLICEKHYSYGSIFSLNETLKESIHSKDGILSVYFGWLLEKKGIGYEVGKYSGKYENDFIIENSILVECKMFKSEKDSVAIRSEIDSSLSQINKHIKQLHSEGIKIEEVYLLWNRNDNEEKLQKKVYTKYKSLFEEYSFKIICPDEIEDFINF